MYSTYLLPLLLAVGTLAGPILDRRNLPNGVKHPYDHMAFHQHEARDRQTPAEQLMDELVSLGVNNPIPGAGTGTGTGGSSSPSPPVQLAQPEVKVVVVTDIVGPDGQPIVQATSTSTSTSTSSTTTQSPSPTALPQGAAKNKIVLPAVQQPSQSSQPVQSSQASPVQQSTPAPASGGQGGMPSAPSEFLPDLTGDDPTYKALVLLHHNIHRANHSLAPLTWNDTLFEYAKESAQSCVYTHTKP